MVESRPRLAKLTAPVPARAYLRTRLFARLDAALDGRVVWLSAEAGAGKTTLVASYLADRGHTALWYHLDRGDADPAGFFGCLAQGVGGPTPLPSFTAEYLGGLEAFARNYFRQLYTALGPQRLLVLDDYHEVDAESPLNEVMRQGLDEVPEGVTVVVISRNDPPPALARARMRDDFTLVGREELLLSAEEAAGVCRLRRAGEPLSEALLTQLHLHTRGWMAGLVLLLEQLRDGGSFDEETPLVFDYLAGEVYARMGADEQALLIKTALLPDFSAEAARSLTGLPHARDLLEALYRRNYFTARHLHDSGPPTYEYHPLFRRFLLELGRRRLPAAELIGLKRAAAELLAAGGAIDACVALLREIGDWPLLARLIGQHAPGLLRGGRYRTLEEWLGALPPEVHAGEPWLDYFHGLAAMPFDLEQARGWFERAFDAFKAAVDAGAIYLAWAGIVDTYLYAWADFRPADRWIAELELLRDRHPGWPSLEVQVRVTTGIFAILIYRRPDHPQLPAWTDQLEALLLRDIDPVLRMTAAAHLVLYFAWWQGDIARARRLLERLAAYGEEDATAPLTRVTWAASQAIYFWVSGDTDACARVAGEGLRVAAESGVRLWDAMLLAQLIWAELTTGNPEAAEVPLRRFEALLHPAQILHVCQYHFQRLCHAAYGADHDVTLAHAQAALDKALEAGVIWAEGIVRYGKAFAHYLRDEPAERDAELALAGAIWQRSGDHVVGEGTLVVRAFAALDRGDEASTQHALWDLFGLLRTTGLNNCTIGQPARFSRLCAEALRHDIEPEYVRQLIRLRRFRPEPGAADEAWPWPVRIRTLGGFSVELDGKPLTFSGKAQRRPLALLQNLLAHGGHQVPETRIAEALWPDADGDAAHFAFHTTLKRLRSLLGAKDLLQFRDGLLTLDAQACWVDLWALDRLGADDVAGWLRLYRGPFLAHELDAVWPMAARERLRRRFLGVVLRSGEALEAQGDVAGAEALYERALRAEEADAELQRRFERSRARQ